MVHESIQQLKSLLTSQEEELDLALPMTEVEEFAGVTNSVSKVWIGDTGSSCHLVTSDKGVIKIKTIDEDIKIGNGSTMSATKMGHLPVTIKQKDETTTKSPLEGVKFVPKLWCNLFSIVRVLSKGWDLEMRKK